MIQANFHYESHIKKINTSDCKLSVKYFIVNNNDKNDDSSFIIFVMLVVTEKLIKYYIEVLGIYFNICSISDRRTSKAINFERKSFPKGDITINELF